VSDGESAERPSVIGGLPVALFAFPGPVRDRLVAAILAGRKTATASLRCEYLPEGPDPLPEVGARSVVVDSQHRPVAVIETAEVRVLGLGDVDERFARDEGEGFETVAAWRAAHERFWTSAEFRAAAGGGVSAPTDGTQVVAERFRLVRTIQ